MAGSSDPIARAHEQWLRHGWSDAADGMAMVTSLVRVQQLLMERIDEALRPHALSFARFELLRLLAFSSRASMPMTRVGSLLQVHPTSVSSAAGRLEAQGLIRRRRHDDDRRVVLAELTDEGRQVVEAATTSLNAVFSDPGLPAAEVDALTASLTALRSGLGDDVS